MRLILLLLAPSLAAAGSWEASGGQCGVNSTCAVGALSATSFANSGNETVTGTLGVAGATALGTLSAGNVVVNSLDAGYVRATGNVEVAGTLAVAGQGTFADISAIRVTAMDLNSTTASLGAAVANDIHTGSIDAGFIRNAGALIQVGQVTCSAGISTSGTISTGGTNVIASGGNLYGGYSSTAAVAMAGASSGNPTIYYLGGSGNGAVDMLIQDGGTIGLGANLRVTAAGGLLGTGSDLGLLQVDTANTDCTTVCSSVDAGTCFIGQNLAALTYKLVACSSTTADNCICLGHPP